MNSNLNSVIDHLSLYIQYLQIFDLNFTHKIYALNQHIKSLNMKVSSISLSKENWIVILIYSKKQRNSNMITMHKKYCRIRNKNIFFKMQIKGIILNEVWMVITDFHHQDFTWSKIKKSQYLKNVHKILKKNHWRKTTKI